MGNFISKLFGSSKPETVTEKFARQDAEFKAKHPERFQQPTQTAKTPTAPGNAIGDYVGMTALQRREKAAGLKAGGMIRKKCLEGGEITGPGGPTDDLVPIDASNGEFMIKASSAKILGEDVLEALNDLGDEPKNKNDDKAEDDKEGMKCGGAVRKKMAMGGPVEMPMNTDPMSAQDQQAFGALQNTATGVAPVAPAAPTTQMTTGPKQLRSSTIAALGSYTPLPIPQLKAGGMVRKMYAGGQVKFDPAKDSQAANFEIANAQAGYLPGESVMERTGRRLSSLVPAVSGVAKKIAHPEQPWTTPSVEHVPATPATAATATTPAPTTTVVQSTPSMPAPKPTPASAPADEFSNAAVATRNPGGMVRKVGNSYSGSNITGDVSFQGANGNALPGRPGGGFVVGNGMSPGLIKSTLTNPDGSAWSAGDNSIMAANLRDGVDPYRGTSRDARNDPMNQPMTKDQRAARVRLAEVNSQNKRYAQANAVEQDRLGVAKEQLGMSRTEHVAKMAKEKQVADVQAEYLAAGDDPVKQAAAKRKMLALGLMKEPENKFTVVPEFDGNGQRIGTTVLDNQGKPINTTGGQAALPPGMTKQVGTANGKPVYEDANGKRFQ